MNSKSQDHACLDLLNINTPVVLVNHKIHGVVKKSKLIFIHRTLAEYLNYIRKS
jgi:hypothetical protein